LIQGLSQGSVFGIYQIRWVLCGCHSDGLNGMMDILLNIRQRQQRFFLKVKLFPDSFQGRDKNYLWVSDTGPQELYRFNTSTGISVDLFR